MAKEKTSAEQIFDKLCNEVLIAESYLCGIFWGNTEYFSHFSDEQLNGKTFINKRLGFYFSLGRHMFSKGVVIFDDITVANYVNELNVGSQYESYGYYDGINEIVLEVADKHENLDSYYEEVKKYNLIKNLVGLFGSKVVETNGKYDYKRMSREQLQNYWLDKVNKLSMDGDNKFVEGNLLKGLRDEIDSWDFEPSIGLPFYKSKMLTDVVSGFERGMVYINGSFSGMGKTSFTFSKVIMSHIVNKIKLLVIANEEDITAFRKMLLVTVMGNETNGHFNRQRLNEGHFTEQEREKIDKALQWIEEVVDGEDGLIKFVFMENYSMPNVRKVVTHYALRGYESLIIDTGKPSIDSGGKERWQSFTDDFREIHSLVKADTGLNLRTYINIQLADSAMNMRFLDYGAIGVAKAIKNEASVVMMMRSIWSDEYESEKHEIECYRYVPKDEAEIGDPFNEQGDIEYVEGKPYVIKRSKLKKRDERGNKIIYYLLFLPKNRRGRSSSNGLDPLVMAVDLNSNRWKEIGYAANVQRDFTY